MAKKQQIGPKGPERISLPIRLVIIDNELEDWIAVLEGLRRESNTIKLLASFNSMSLALPLLEEGRVDIVLVGEGLPWFEGVPCARFLKQRWARLVVVSIDRKASGGQRQTARFNSAHPRLLQPVLAKELVDILHKSMRAICLRNTQKAAVSGAPAITARDLWIQEKGLTSREVETLGLLAHFLLDKEMADQLRVSEPVVKKVLRNIYAKLGVHHRAEAINIWNRVLQ